MGEPPSLVGAINEILIVESLATATTFVGTPGTVVVDTGVAETVDEYWPIPFAFSAAT